MSGETRWECNRFVIRIAAGIGEVAGQRTDAFGNLMLCSKPDTPAVHRSQRAGFDGGRHVSISTLNNDIVCLRQPVRDLLLENHLLHHVRCMLN